MAFSRPDALGPLPASDELTGRLVGIGMLFAAEPTADPLIEETLVHASDVAMNAPDFRLLSVLTTWLGVHHAYVNADRLIRCVSEHRGERVCAYWAAVAVWLSSDRRFGRLVDLHDGTDVHLLLTGGAFQIERQGEDERFVGSVLRVPARTLRDREADVIEPRELARRHQGYRNRVMFGPTWRADVWTVLEQHPESSVAEAARLARCTYATAWGVVRDFRLVHDRLSQDG